VGQRFFEVLEVFAVLLSNRKDLQDLEAAWASPLNGLR